MTIAANDIRDLIARLWREHTEAYVALHAFQECSWESPAIRRIMEQEIHGEFDRLDRTLEVLVRVGPFPPEVREAINVVLATYPHPDGVHLIGNCLEADVRESTRDDVRAILRSYFRGGQS